MTQRLVQELGPTHRYTGLVTPFPGSCDFAVSHGVYCMVERGRGKAANSLRLDQLTQLGYSGAVCFVNQSNECQQNILKHGGWICGPQLRNYRTDSLLNIWVVQLPEYKGEGI